MKLQGVDNQHQSVLNDDRVGRLLAKFSLPALLGLVVMILYNVVDTIFIGRYVGSLGIAGISIVFPAQMLILGMGQMVGIGSASLISRTLGAPRSKPFCGAFFLKSPYNLTCMVIFLQALKIQKLYLNPRLRH